MGLTENIFKQMLVALEKQYPQWNGFADQRFVQEEVGYKQANIARARDLLGETEVRGLVETRNFDEMIARLDKIGKKTNLLYLGVPKAGDLGILYRDDLDKPSFCAAVLDLLYGPGPSPERLARYADYVRARGLPNKWTFPTFFLFMRHPETDFFVKPLAVQWFLNFAGAGIELRSNPTAEVYAAVLKFAAEVRSVFSNYQPKDMVDVQGLIWVCYAQRPGKKTLAKPFNSLFGDWEEAEWAFDFLSETARRLGITGPEDPLASFTLRYDGEYLLRFSYGNWLILGFRGNNGNLRLVDVALLDNKVVDDSVTREKFTQKENEPQVWLYLFPAKEAKSFEGKLDEVHVETLKYLVERFRGWKGSPYHTYSVPEVAKAVIEVGQRERLLSRGLAEDMTGDTDESRKDLKRLESETFEKPPLGTGDASPTLGSPAFSQHTPEYTLVECAGETGFEEALLDRWVRAIERKGQAIIYGPPGTGKTYIAEKLARHLVGGGDGFFEVVQFHPAYAYEDFVQGIRPKARADGTLDYPVLPGRFLQFCGKAGKRNQTCVLIIDEINRANLARVFGELMYLLEYRERDVPLAAGGSFCIPANVRILGTMNTADRSIALVDHALRRRFAFLALAPNYEILRQYHAKHATGFPIEKLIGHLERLNKQINDDHYAVGVSFFLRPDLSGQIEDIWRMEIEPYLEEYFFDQPEKVDEFRWEKIAERLRA